MSNADTIKEFLVSLGFKIDESSFKKFDAATGLTTRNVAKLGFATIAAAAAVELFVKKMAESMDRLYFMSKRTGASVEEINAFSFAVSQMGGTADDAKASLENLARFMRTQPGAGGLLTRVLGVKPEHLKDTAKVMNDLAVAFQHMPMYLAERYSGMLGIDEKTMLAMRETGTMTGKEDQYAKMAKERGIDLDALAKSSMEFNNQLKTLDGSFGLLAAKLEGELLPFMGQLNELVLGLTSDKPGSATVGFFDWVGKHSYLNGVFDKFVGAGNAIGNNILNTQGLRNNNPGNLRSWGNNPTSGGFARFPDAFSGLSAMAKQLALYGARGTDTLAGIVSRWAPSSDGNNTAAYISDMMKRTGFGAGEHLNMRDPATLEKLMNGITMHENGKNPYSAALVSSAARSATQATISQKTDINVYTSDPKSAASDTAAAQGRVNQQMVRNLVGAVQ